MHFLTSLLGALTLLAPTALAQDDSSSTLSSSSIPSSTPSSTSTPTATSSETPSSSASLSDAASSHGAGRWGAVIARQLSTSARGGRTAFVPVDDEFPTRRVRQTEDETQQYLYQVSDQLLTAADLRNSTGSVIESLSTNANLGGRGQAVISQGQRGDSYDADSSIGLFSGLGNNVTIVEQDIPFNGGIIHIISGPFTPPSPLSDTLRASPRASNFSSHISSQVSSLGSTSSITLFVPTNDALSASLGSNVTVSESEATALADSHVISGSVAYSPRLVDGASFQTANGRDITVTVDESGEVVLNNDIRLVQSDIIIENGVVHLINKPLYTPDDGTVFTGAAESAFRSSRMMMMVGAFAAIVGGTAYF
ncbi:hypothetical protein ASPVEDRAFT_515191 [Aspergillus versicolor CBS 583.65]|uniref:FAS1 domain-containing protein n=1 Tax=Aspergillus versicolor CBS 583.65 TaxID=1036611 RepID=A0A1L9PD33_ASPVE|nr:uncharacterized protein ASPVEDRAFT_515191 [Aspergillus versicolor CBS 583.65]OJI99440.1 hypothetical protein ASPVEDRAFT_515191 [Aspergillus versicolor CBS 583.65]